MSSIAPKTALTLKLFRELKDRLIAVSKDREMQAQLIRDGTLNSEGEWPFLEWSISDQTMVETLDEPLNTSQVVSGLGDIIARTSTDPDDVRWPRPAPTSALSTVFKFGGSGVPTVTSREFGFHVDQLRFSKTGIATVTPGSSDQGFDLRSNPH